MCSGLLEPPQHLNIKDHIRPSISPIDMAASRRAQIQALCGVRTGPLIDRVESYLAAVDIWSRRGNAKAVKNAGTGVVAVCCYLAAER